MVSMITLFNDERDENKFDYLYDLYWPRMVRVAYSIIHDIFYAEDIVQEAFMCVAANIHMFDNGASEKNTKLVYVITRNKAIDFYRKRKRQEEHIGLTREPVSVHNIETLVISSENVKIITGALTELPDEAAKTMELYCLRDLSRSEIAEKLGISYNTVTVRLLRAKKKLVKKLLYRDILT